MKRFLVCLLLLGSLLPSRLSARTRVIAHRGYWKCEGSAQNSLTALKMADRIKAYGSECDIWITADDQLIVTHDNTLKKAGETLAIAQSTYEELKDVKLGNGERLPTLDDYLQTGKACKNTKLILELKTHPSKEKSLLLARKVVDKVKAYKLKKRVEYIAFSLDIAKEVIRLDPKAKVYYLNGDLSPRELKDLGFAGLDYHAGVLKKNVSWADEAHQLGLKVNVWTVNKAEDMQYFIDRKVEFITTDEPELLQSLLQKKK